MIVYSVHSYAWGQVGEIELLTADRVVAEDRARQRSRTAWHCSLFVTRRELEKADSLHVLSQWQDGEKIKDFGDGEWRRSRPVG